MNVDNNPPDDLIGHPANEARRERKLKTGSGRGAAKGWGQEPHEPTEVQRAKVSLWASMGTTTQIIADLLMVHRTTVERHYAVELKDSGAYAVGKIAACLFDKAVSGDVTSMIFYLKTRGRWSEKAPLGDKDNPIVIQGVAHNPTDVAVALARKLRSDASSVVEASHTVQ